MLNIDRPEHTKRSEDKSSDFYEEQEQLKHLRLKKEFDQKKKAANFDRLAAQLKCDEMKRDIKKLEAEINEWDVEKIDEDDPFVRDQMEEMRVKANRWKISDKNWMGIVGAIGSGLIIFLIMAVNSIFATMLGAEEGGDEG